MKLIDTEEAAKRLARVILSDIEIYNRHKVWSEADLKPQVDDGYALFRTRVAPALVPLFSEMVAHRWPKVVTPAATEPAAARPTRKEPLDPRETARRLARVVASSIQGRDRPDGGAGLPAEIAEARALFRTCVLPELAPLFEEALAEVGLLESRPAPTPQPRESPPPMLVSPFESTKALPSTTTEQTTRTAPDILVEEGPRTAAGPDPDEDQPTMPVAALAVKQPSLVERSPSKRWLALVAIAVAVATAGIVYLLLT